MLEEKRRYWINTSIGRYFKWQYRYWTNSCIEPFLLYHHAHIQGLDFGDTCRTLTGL